MLSGVDDVTVEQARSIGLCHLRNRQQAFHACLCSGMDAWTASLGSSTRSQINRTERRLEKLGPLSWRKACGISEGIDFLDAMAEPHKIRWQQRNQPGAFDDAFLKFHRELVVRGLPRGEVELWQLAAGAQVAASLYNFRHRGRVYAYQSGIDQAAAPGASPGLLAHKMAMADAAATGVGYYDFLAGDSRYKRSLSNGSATLRAVSRGVSVAAVT